MLWEIKDQVPGTVKFIFQPAEEGAPQGEEGGAELMIKDRCHRLCVVDDGGHLIGVLSELDCAYAWELSGSKIN